jgi:hypothetical protein
VCGAWSFLEGLAAERLGDTALPVDDLKETQADLDAMGKLLDQLPAMTVDIGMAIPTPAWTPVPGHWPS